LSSWRAAKTPVGRISDRRRRDESAMDAIASTDWEEERESEKEEGSERL